MVNPPEGRITINSPHQKENGMGDTQEFRNLPVGIDDFSSIIRAKSYYIDKDYVPISVEFAQTHRSSKYRWFSPFCTIQNN
jgi:hypothetical protein